MDWMNWINNNYGTQYRRGQRVIAYGEKGVITGADGQYLRIRIDGDKFAQNYHPTDGIEIDNTEKAQ
jgi:hypothetical protein